MIYEKIFKSKGKKLAVLIDPGKQSLNDLRIRAELARKSGADFFLVGGSMISENIDDTVSVVKESSGLPVILFPGSMYQLSAKADAVLLLSLISGRNPDFLIGNQVIAAPFLKKSGLEVISAGYMLIDGGSRTSVEYISNTVPIPADKPDIASATALAGEMLGLSLIYLEAGSGARYPVRENIVKSVRESISIPLIAGGGIKDVSVVESLCESGADIIVTGTAFEKDAGLIKAFSDTVHSFQASKSKSKFS